MLALRESVKKIHHLGKENISLAKTDFRNSNSTIAHFKKMINPAQMKMLNKLNDFERNINNLKSKPRLVNALWVIKN